MSTCRPNSEQETDEARRFIALTFILGAVTWGIAAYFVMVYARHMRDKSLAFNAKQCFVWNLTLGLVFAGVILAGGIARFVLAVLGVEVPSVCDGILMVVLPATMIVFNMMLNLVGAVRVLRGKPFLFPLIGKKLRNK